MNIRSTNYVERARLLVMTFSMTMALLTGVASSTLVASTTKVPYSAYISLPRGEEIDFGTPPNVPSGALNPALLDAINVVFGDNFDSGEWGPVQHGALETIARSNDPRAAWIISDFMRIVSSASLMTVLAETVSELLAVDIGFVDAWGTTTDYLIAWDIPAPPGYLSYKRKIFTTIVPQWDKIFTPGDIDWRHVSWGGVNIDDRAFGDTDRPCNCIPAADNPPVMAAVDARWLDDEAVVFGIEVNGEYRAYPRRIMEVREMVNDTLGGRSLGIPYCTLCGAAHAYFTDEVPDGVERPVLRTSGLLIRSNKVMYDINTYSVFDTFRGHAVTGPLAEKGVKLRQAGVVTTSWGQWKQTHPETTVLVEALALGRDFDFRNNRDVNGPIFPIGDVDPRLPVHEDVLGIVTDKGTPIAFHIDTAIDVLGNGYDIVIDNVRLVLDGGGVRAVDPNGKDIGGHQAFWFAWSQFYPKTQLWPLTANSTTFAD